MVPSLAGASTSGVVISQLYGGNGTIYSADYVELFNAGSAPVVLDNWSIQYASATGTGSFSNNGITTINTTLQPGQYYLVQLASSAGGTVLSPDLVGAGTNLSSSKGKVVLVDNNAGLTCNGGSTVCDAGQLAQIVDMVGYGSANFYEGSAAAPTLNSSLAALRGDAGCVDTNANNADFSAATPTPRNSTSAFNVCSGGSGQPLVPVCPASVSVASGTVLSVDLSATDADSVVNGVSLISVVPASAALSLGALTPAGADGGSATVSLDVAGNALVGSYAATVEFTNDDGQSATCAVGITVTTAGGSYTPIYTIQGSGPLSAYDGQVVTTRGVVTKLTNAGFFMQDANGDGNTATSDGIYVYTVTAPTVTLGQEVEVTATVDEYDASNGASALASANPITELKNITQSVVIGTGSIAPRVINLPEAFDGELEQVEGMLVTIGTPMTVSQNYFQGRYGQVTLGAGDRLYKPTMQYRPGTPDAIAVQDLNNRSSILLDDGSSLQNPNPIPYIGVGNTLRAGDTASTITGVIDYGLATSSTSGIADWRIQPTTAITFTRANVRPASAPAVGGNVKVASFNVLNYFNGDGFGGGFPTSRGATTAIEFTRQRDKIIAAIVTLNADVVGLEEIENDGTGSTSAIQDLVNGLNAVAGAGTYAVAPQALTGTGNDEIKVAIIYKPAVVDLIAGTNLSDTSAIHDRPPVAQGFSLKANGEKFSVVMNHFKSKRCNSPTGGDVDAGDGQGCYNDRRTQQATELLNFIATVQAATADDDVLVMGDLNAYGKEDPVYTLETGGLVNELARFETHPYSYVFDGEAGSLDQALATTTLSAQVSGVSSWHINADEPSVIDYNTEFKPQDFYAPDMYRSSDHDPILVGLTLGPLDVQSISFALPGDQLLGTGSLNLVATASSGLPVSFTSQSAGVCAVNGSTVTLLAVGQCSVAANQSGGSGYAPAAEVIHTFSVRNAQSIDFAALGDTTLEAGSLTLIASASSGLPVSFVSTTPSVCGITGMTLTLLAQGNCSVTATQVGDSSYAAATPVSRSFAIVAGGVGGGEDGDVPIPLWALGMLAAGLLAATRRTA